MAGGGSGLDNRWPFGDVAFAGQTAAAIVGTLAFPTALRGAVQVPGGCAGRSAQLPGNVHLRQALLRSAESIPLSAEMSWWYVMADSLYLPVKRSSQYPRSPRFFLGALRLLYEFAFVNGHLHGIGAYRKAMRSHTVDLIGQTTEYILNGETGPTIVLESGLGDTLEVWGKLIEKIDIQARLCLYNRSGYGKSKSSSLKRDALTIAKELHILLHGLRLNPPYILVGHSLGCVFVRVFADLYPDEVNGVLLIDPMIAEMDELCRENAIKGWEPSKIRRIITSILLSKGAKRELTQREASLKQAKGSKNIKSSIPTGIITADRGMAMYSKQIQHQWLRSHELLAHNLPSCTHIVAQNSKHHVQIDQPEIVIEMLKKMLPS